MNPLETSNHTTVALGKLTEFKPQPDRVYNPGRVLLSQCLPAEDFKHYLENKAVSTIDGVLSKNQNKIKYSHHVVTLLDYTTTPKALHLLTRLGEYFQRYLDSKGFGYTVLTTGTPDSIDVFTSFLCLGVLDMEDRVCCRVLRDKRLETGTVYDITDLII